MCHPLLLLPTVGNPLYDVLTCVRARVCVYLVSVLLRLRDYKAHIMRNSASRRWGWRAAW